MRARARFQALPETVTVYRGCNSEYVDGVSWSTSKKVAGYFASGGRYGRPDDPVIATGKIERCWPDFYFLSGDERGEEEIVCLPEVICVDDYKGPRPKLWR